MADRLDVRTSDRERVQLQHLARRLIRQLQPSVRIDDDDAFDHARENRLHPGTIARQFGQAPPQLLH